MNSRLLVALAVFTMSSSDAAQYDTLPAASAWSGFTLSLTTHPGLCDTDEPHCVSTHAPVSTLPVQHGDRVVVGLESADSASSAVVRLDRIYVPVALHGAGRSEPITIQVALEPGPRLNIRRGGSESSFDVVPDVWIELPSIDATPRLYLRLDSPANGHALDGDPN